MSEKKPLEPFEDPNDERNGAKFRTGKQCIDCPRPAGTAWSPVWCFECNVARMRRVSASLASIAKRRA